jgi:hypothetical protein
MLELSLDLEMCIEVIMKDNLTYFSMIYIFKPFAHYIPKSLLTLDAMSI